MSDLVRRVQSKVVYAARLLLISLAPAGACLHAAPSSAHALILRSHPALQATVAPGDVPVMLELNSRVDSARSRLTARRPDGTEIALTVSVSNDETVVSSRVVATMPGVWILRWQVLARDGHITRGEIPFTVSDPPHRP